MVWGKMEKCLDRNQSKRQITVQIIVDIIIWIAVGLPVLYLFISAVPFERGFFCDDTSIRYPYKPDTISTTWLLILGFGASLIIVTVIELLNCVDRRRRHSCCSSSYLFYCVKGYAVFLVGFVIDQLFVDAVKNKTGRLRPNFLDVCKPKYNVTLCSERNVYITDYVCTSITHDASDVRDSRQSFPSGHAAFSMYTAAYFCLYMERRLDINYSRILKPMLQMVFLFLATLCGVSRIQDNKHHSSDVIAGFLLGIVSAVAVHYTIGLRVLKTRRVSFDKTTSLPVSLPTIRTKPVHCTCQLTPEPQTPLPLLENEYRNGFAVTSEYDEANRRVSAP